MSSLRALAAIVLVIACIAVILVARRQRRLRAESRKLEMEQAIEQDAMHRASAKLKYMNSTRKRSEGESSEQDPLKDLFGMEIPSDFRPVKNKNR